VDTGDPESAKLPVKEVSLNALGQRRRGRQDSGGENHGWAQPQAEGKQRPMMREHSKQVLPAERMGSCRLVLTISSTK
jgi:hypothetical protein